MGKPRRNISAREKVANLIRRNDSMKKTHCLILVVILIMGAPRVRSQEPSCAGPQPGHVGFSIGNCQCSITTPGSSETEDVYWIPYNVTCCGTQQLSYYDGGSCVVVNGKLDLPAMRQVLEFSKTHELLVARCDGQYLPLQALLRSQPPEISFRSLNTRRIVSELETR